MIARQHQSNTKLLGESITDAQLKALHTKITASGIQMSRSTRLEVFREIFGYDTLLTSTKDLTKADAMGVLDMNDQDFGSLLLETLIGLEDGVRI